MILPGAEPFFLPGGKNGVLLIHGFTGLPAEMRLMGEHLQKRGFTVLAVRLAGHAATEEDLSRTTHEDWLDSVRDGYALLAGATEKISVVGHSMGGILAFGIAAEKKVERIVTMAAPIFIAPEQGLDRLPPRDEVRGLYHLRHKRRLKDVPAAANQTYRRMPLISIHEVLDLIKIIKELLPDISVPTLIMHSRRDHTAAPESAEYIYKHIKSAEKEIVWLEGSGHLLPLDVEREQVFSEAAAFLER